MNDYYVYEHIRLDNNTCFYVGKGRKNRAYIKTRNKAHDEIAKKYGMKVKIIKDNLTEDEALLLEYETIKKYIDLGYSLYDKNCELTGNKYLTNIQIGTIGIKNDNGIFLSNKRASAKYEKEKIKQLTIRISAKSKQKLDEYIKNQNEYSSLNKMVLGLLENKTGIDLHTL